MAKPALFALGVLVLLSGGCTAGPSAPVEADTPASGPIVPSPSPDARHIQPGGVSADSGDQAWAVGHYKKDGYNSRHRTLILHWDGTSWSPVASPNPSARSNSLRGVSAVSATDAWAVGSNGNETTNAVDALILHWDGTSWLQVTSPNPTHGSSLFGVSADSTTDAWAVGDYYDSNLYLDTLILHWDGTSWSKVPSPNPSEDLNGLSGVSALSTDDAWAVGDYRDDTTLLGTTLILHWDGTSWSQVPSPNPYESDLNGVSAVSATDAWAVGSSYERSPGGAFHTLILRWDGMGWSQVPSPSPSSYNYLLGVDAVSPNDAWAVGYFRKDGYNSPHRTLILHWDGTSWSKVPSPNPSARLNHLTGVSAPSATDAWAVGNYRNNKTGDWDTLILHWDGTIWSKT
jgi:hypothetical protein